MEASQVEELLYEALETERGSIKMYRAALSRIEDPALQDEWRRHLEETEHHERILLGLCMSLGLDPEKDTLGRQIVRHRGLALVSEMELALTGRWPEPEPPPEPPPLSPAGEREGFVGDGLLELLELEEELAVTR